MSGTIRERMGMDERKARPRLRASIAASGILLLLLAPAVARSQVGEPQGGVNGAPGQIISTDTGVVGQFLEGPVDPERYRLGPGDQLAVRILTHPPVDRITRLTPEGMLILPEGVSLPLAGVPLADAQTKVEFALRRYYREPQVLLHLIGLRTFGVYVIGEVVRPGMVSANAMDRASEVIARAGGVLPDSMASERAIVLKRADGHTLPVDIGLFLATGSLVHNPLVEAGDRVYVPPIQATASVSGSVRMPGRAEVVDGDSVATLLSLAHGLAENATTDSAYIQCYVGDSGATERRYLDLANAADRALPVHPRDVLFVRQTRGWKSSRTVTVQGEVRFPGVHALPADSARLSDVIRLAGGFTPSAALAEAHVLRPRLGFKDAEWQRLQDRATSEMTKDEYQYYSMMAEAQAGRVAADFVALFERNDPRGDAWVRSGDRVVVPVARSAVRVLGEVVRPGEVTYQAGLEVSDYVQRAGGYLSRASKGKVTIYRPVTGEWSKKDKVKEIRAGDMIWVPRRDVSVWRGIREGLTIATQLATIYLVVESASN